MMPFISNSVSIIFSFIIIIALPLIMYICIQYNGNIHVYFYTIDSNADFTKVKTLPIEINHEVSVNIDQVYSFDEILWNIDNVSYENITIDKIKLVFCDNSFKYDNLDIRHALKIHFDPNNVLRQSSQTSLSNNGNSGTQFRISDLYYSAKKSGHVYFSISEPTIEHLTPILNCSNSLSVSINNFIGSDENNCQQEKLLSYDQKIVERKCLKYNNDQIEPLEILCGRNQHLNKIAFLNKNMYIKKNYLSFPSGLGENFCCLNSSHFLVYYGECSDQMSPLNLDSRSIDYETPNCPIYNNRQHSLFLKLSADCLVSLSALTECNDDSKYIDCDTTSFACNDIVH